MAEPDFSFSGRSMPIHVAHQHLWQSYMSWKTDREREREGERERERKRKETTGESGAAKCVFEDFSCRPNKLRRNTKIAACYQEQQSAYTVHSTGTLRIAITDSEQHERLFFSDWKSNGAA